MQPGILNIRWFFLVLSLALGRVGEPEEFLLWGIVVSTPDWLIKAFWLGHIMGKMHVSNRYFECINLTKSLINEWHITLRHAVLSVCFCLDFYFSTCPTKKNPLDKPKCWALYTHQKSRLTCLLYSLPAFTAEFLLLNVAELAGYTYGLDRTINV